jgi:hypothetical protein
MSPNFFDSGGDSLTQGARKSVDDRDDRAKTVVKQATIAHREAVQTHVEPPTDHENTPLRVLDLNLHVAPVLRFTGLNGPFMFHDASIAIIEDVTFVGE